MLARNVAPSSGSGVMLALDKGLWIQSDRLPERRREDGWMTGHRAVEEAAQIGDNTARRRSRRDASRGARLVVIAAMVIATLIVACRNHRDASRGARPVVITAKLIDALRNARGADRAIVCTHALVARTRHIWVDKQGSQRRRKSTDGGSNVPSEARWELEGQNAS
jgi:hypothetical protein